MRAPKNPIRRNRNIGTVRQGRGRDNRLVIPEGFHEDTRVFYERLTEPREIEFEVHGERRIALVEEPSPGRIYGCTVDDLKRLLEAMPPDEIEDLPVFLFRNPTRKQRILSSVWGRFLYYATPGRFEGSAICFESSDLEPLEWSKSISPETERELERLKADGHRVAIGKRSIRIEMTEESLRATVLFRTALHEIGHYVDWCRSSLNVEGTEQEEERARRSFRSKPRAMKEDFAHRFASETYARLRDSGEFPFPVEWDEQEMDRAGVERSWFVGDHA